MSAKLLPLVANELIEQVSQEKGVTFLSGYVDNKTSLRFLCKQCGQETKMTWGQFQQGKNPGFLCLSCSYANRSKTTSISYDELKADVESKGSKLLTPHDVKLNTHTELSLICTYCGDIFKLRFGDYKRGRNKKLRCSKCAHIVHGGWLNKKEKRVSHEDNRLQTYTEIKSIVESVGAELLTSYNEYETKKSYIRFKCSQCGKEHKIQWSKFEEGRNPKLLCQDCLPEKKEYTTEIVKEEFAKHDVELMNEYENLHSPLIFKCKQCGSITSITWGNYLYLGRNQNFLCGVCRKGNYSSDPTAVTGTYSENGIKRNKAEARSREFCKNFYNLGKDIRGDYESHHIKPMKQFPNLQYSLGNLYPLPTVEHHTNNFSYYHYLEESRNPENWPDTARLPQHDYEGFKFLDLNKYLITDFILTEDRNLFDKKKQYAEQGILYIPFYFQEMDVIQNAFISYSMIRSRLAKVLGTDIYKYTGQKFVRYNTRKLNVKIVSEGDAVYFFDRYHIQGYAEAAICLGLYANEKLISAMSFGIPRNNKWRGAGNYEMIRFCSVLNSSVPGAVSKLFKAFVKQYDPELVVTFCDCRFSSVNPLETVYQKLGFEYDGYSKPNYKYYKDGEYFSRHTFMKYKLSKKLDNFDPNLSEMENMHRNGYLKLYDCGNFRYVWRKDKTSETV